MTNRRRFLGQITALLAAGTAAPAILARMRPLADTFDHTSDADHSALSESPYHFSDNYLEGPGAVGPPWSDVDDVTVTMTVTTQHGVETYRAPIVDGVADFSGVMPGERVWITGVSQDGSPVVRAQIKL